MKTNGSGKGKKGKYGFGRQIRKNRTLIAMLLPALLYVVVFSYIPMFGVTIAFKDYNYNDGVLRSPWCGLQNFEYLKISGKLLDLTKNTLLYNLAFIVFGILFEVGFALMLSEITGRVFKKVSQAFLFLPYFISWVVVSTVMLNIFGQNGVLSNILSHFGIEDFSIYHQVRQWPLVMVAVRLWKQTGYGTVVYLAAIAGLSQEMFEVSAVRGEYFQGRFRDVLPDCGKQPAASRDLGCDRHLCLPVPDHFPQYRNVRGSRLLPVGAVLCDHCIGKLDRQKNRSGIHAVLEREGEDESKKRKG